MMETAPKYVLKYEGNQWDMSPYVIREYAVVDDKISNRVFSIHENLEQAVRALSKISNGPVVLAYSAQEIDNTFDICKD